MDFPSSKLSKALANKAFTSASRPAWQEALSRHSSVPSKAMMAPEVIQEFAGSWAAQFALGAGQQSLEAPESPAPVQRTRNHLGQPGMAEINFRPYDWGTTRHGKYGPSLLGHPVSFEVVGPTAKSPFLYHQWRVNTSGTEDVLTLDSCTWRSTALVPEALPGTLASISDIYNISAIPEEGLYLLVSMTGSEGYLDDVGAGVPGVGGVGDGLFGVDLAAIPTRAAISTKNNGTAQNGKFEIFRVVQMTGTTLRLDSVKRLSDHFTIPGGLFTPIIRAVTLLKPAAARVVAVPGSGAKGAEQVFAIIPPEKSLNADLMPPASVWTTVDADPWTGFNGGASTGALGDYAQKNALPIPRALRAGKGRLHGIFGEAPIALNTGLLKVVVDPTTTTSSADVGKVVQIHNIARRRSGDWATATLDGGSRVGDPDLDRLLGGWEIVAVLPGAGVGGEDIYHLRMVAQVDPLTGVPFYGSADYMRMAQTGLVSGMEVRLQWTLHEPISALWTTKHSSVDKINSARLRHLIDPDWVQPTLKNFDTRDTEASPARPDVVSFRTGSSGSGAVGTNEDPGSLLDLGFRVVLYPAKPSVADPNKLVPDFHNPITTNEVVLDPNLPGEKQFVEIDYAAGLVYLSHAPVPGTGCQLVPTASVLTNADNPRGEVVFFASYVAFSHEPGQRGANPRVTGGGTLTVPSGTSSLCNSYTEATDVFGARLFWPLEVGQTITSQQINEIKLDVLLSPLDLPPTGFVTIVRGRGPTGPLALTDGQGRSVSTFGYTEVVYNDSGKTTLKGCFGGGVTASTIVTTATNPFAAVLRRDIVTPNTGDGSTGTDLVFDTTYGHSKRASALHFKGATVTPEPDGSFSIDTKGDSTESHRELFSTLFSSWVLNGGEMLTTLPLVAGSTLEFSEMTVLIGGVRTVIPATTVTVDMTFPGPPLPIYVYIDGSSPTCPVYSTTHELPLPGQDDILIGRYTHTATDITAYQDLRHILTDIDKRLDVTVGVPVGHDQPGDAHFSTLADAVAYVAETMKPTSGFDGRYRRIKVIGPTLEDNAKLPIKPRVQGLIIEGAARRQDGQVGSQLEISWEGAGAPALFDLSGCSGLVIRDVAFRYYDDGSTSVVPEERCLFTCEERVGGDVLRNVVLENIRLHGPAHGFLYVDPSVDATTGFSKVLLRNCEAVDLTDFAIYIDPAIGLSESLLVEQCRFEVRRWDSLTPPELTGVLTNDPAVISVSGLGADRVTIQGTYLSGGQHGIVLGGGTQQGRHRISHVVVEGPSHIGLVITGPSCVVEDSQFLLCYGDALGAFYGLATKVGVYLSLTALYTRFDGCFVSMHTPAAADYVFYSADNGSAPRAHLRDNEFQGGVKIGPFSDITNCFVVDKLEAGDRCHLQHNQVRTVLGTSADVTVGSNCQLTKNVADGHFVMGSGKTQAVLNGNWFKGTTASSVMREVQSTGDLFDGEVLWRGQGVFVGSVFGDGIGNWLVNPVSGGFTNCVITAGRNLALTGDDLTFTGNRFEAPGGPWVFEVDGVRNTFTDNTFEDAYTVHLTNGVRLVVQGNKLLGATVGGLWIEATDSVVCGNTIQGYEAESAVPNTYSLVVEGSDNKVADNVCEFGFLAVSGSANLGVTNNTFKANGLVLGGANSATVVQGNRVGSTGNLDLNGAALVLVHSNYVGGNLLDPGNNGILNGNTVLGNLNATVIADDVVFQGNRVFGNISVSNGASDRPTISGNIVDGSLSTAGDFATVSGNHVGTDLSVSGDDSTVSGNRVVTDLRVQGSGCVLAANRVGGDLDATAAPDVTLLANRVTGNTYLNATGYIAVGNRCTKVQQESAIVGADPDVNGIFLGNRLSVAGGDVNFWGGAMPDPSATGKDHNEPV